jgi:hypothetical protein
VPFLTAREGLLMKICPALAKKYLSLAPGQRAASLASMVDPLPFRQAQAQSLPGSPTDIDTIEYFASPDDICRAFAGLQQLAAQPALAPLGPILSADSAGIGLDPAQWPTVWFKGGSEPGVLTLAIWPPTARARPSWWPGCSATRPRHCPRRPSLNCWQLPGAPSGWSDPRPEPGRGMRCPRAGLPR